MEDDELLEYYLDLDADGENLSDVWFKISKDALTIHQPIDDEEDSKYVAIREDCDPDLWESFVLTFKDREVS